MKKTELYILAGFLGSGKTTLLRQILQTEKDRGRQVGVVMNEFGSVSIDSDAVDGDVPLSELLNGCVCCNLSEQLETNLYNMLHDNDLDAIYIETTGVAHPVEVYDAAFSPLYGDKLEAKGILTMVDASRFLQRGALSPQMLSLYLEQIRHADLVVINKVDLIEEMDLAEISFTLQQLNRDAQVLFTTNAAVNIAQIAALQPTQDHATAEKAPIEKLKIQSLSYTFDGPISLTNFEQWLTSIPDTVFRMKGYVPFIGQSLMSFQYSYGTPIYFPEIMKLKPVLVIIGEQLDKQALTEQLAALR